MRRSAWIFLAAILLPSLALAWMAVRSARDQQVIVEHQQAIICQDITDALAKRIQDQVENSRSTFVQTTDQLLEKSPSTQLLAMNFNRKLRNAWDLAEVGFAVDLRGLIYSPGPNDGLIARTFRDDNARFLSNRENVEVFAQRPSKAPKILSQAFDLQADAGQEQSAKDPNQPPSQQAVQQGQFPAQKVQIERQVVPQSNFGQSTASNTLPEESDFRKVIGTETSGTLARFLEDKLRIMVWYRPHDGSVVYGAQILQSRLADSFRPLLQSPDIKKNDTAISSGVEYSLAILDDRGKPIALSRPGFAADWKHPFAATEIGEALPHWEAALYPTDPKQLHRSAATLQLVLGLIVAVLVAAILLGGWLMASDVRRQMRLAKQQTDFVSNVSHELKTPLTAIRMFADMLSEGRVEERERQNKYLRIISAESARLTRLINNVLDFARMERGAPSPERRPCDLVEIVREVVSTCQPHLDAANVTLSLEIDAQELPVTGDPDALAQIILNLISNAEKYGGHEAVVRVSQQNGFGCVEVLDRGTGIPPKKKEVIFQPFHRLDDSLASGVTGSGLGLTLARRTAQAHGGNVTYSPRPGGGSCFTLTLPLSVPVKTQ